MTGQQGGRGPLHPSNHWGPFADDPWSPLLDMVDEQSWQDALERSRPRRRDTTDSTAVNDQSVDTPGPGAPG